MSDEKKAYRDVLRSSSIIAGASIASLAIGLVRAKFAAVILGPAGLGSIALLQSLLSSATTIFALGLGTVGTRRVAETHQGQRPLDLALVQRSLRWGLVALGALGGASIWLTREEIARHLLGSPPAADTVGWLGLGVALSVAAASQNAELRGTRRIRETAVLTIASAASSAFIGILTIWFWGKSGIAIYVIAAPVTTYVLGLWYTRRAHSQRDQIEFHKVLTEWRSLAKAGFPIMATALVVSGSHFALRSILTQRLGLEALGIFHAAWMIVVTYVGFLITAMSNDYYPKLTGTIHIKLNANAVVNQQVEIGILLATPILLAMQGLSPWIIQLLYTNEFQEARTIIRWQILGDIAKLAAWPLALIALAANNGKIYLATETAAIFVMIAVTWLLIPNLGIEAAGIGYLCMYLLYFPMALAQARKQIDFKFDADLKKLLLAAASMSIASFLATYISSGFGGLLSGVMALATAIYAAGRLWRKSHFGGFLGKVGALSDRLLQRVHL